MTLIECLEANLRQFTASVFRPNHNNEESTRSREGSNVAPHSYSKELSSRSRENAYVDSWNSHIVLSPPKTNQTLGQLSRIPFDDNPPKQENRNPHWG
jgi:hypothetical protein